MSTLTRIREIFSLKTPSPSFEQTEMVLDGELSDHYFCPLDGNTSFCGEEFEDSGPICGDDCGHVMCLDCETAELTHDCGHAWCEKGAE